MDFFTENRIMSTNFIQYGIKIFQFFRNLIKSLLIFKF
jgi:hypothetical protein